MDVGVPSSQPLARCGKCRERTCAGSWQCEHCRGDMRLHGLIPLEPTVGDQMRDAGRELRLRLLRKPAECICARCAYPVRGLDAMSCPECGADLRQVGAYRPGAAATVAWHLAQWTLAWLIFWGLARGIAWQPLDTVILPRRANVEVDHSLVRMSDQAVVYRVHAERTTLRWPWQPLRPLSELHMDRRVIPGDPGNAPERVIWRYDAEADTYRSAQLDLTANRELDDATASELRALVEAMIRDGTRDGEMLRDWYVERTVTQLTHTLRYTHGSSQLSVSQGMGWGAGSFSTPSWQSEARGRLSHERVVTGERYFYGFWLPVFVLGIVLMVWGFRRLPAPK